MRQQRLQAHVEGAAQRRAQPDLRSCGVSKDARNADAMWVGVALPTRTSHTPLSIALRIISSSTDSVAMTPMAVPSRKASSA
jgi:hypothetical protein